MSLPAASTPDLTILRRISYGQTPADLALYAQIGLTGWLDRQLNVTPADTPLVQAMLAGATMPISYAADPGGAYPAVNQNRPLQSLYNTYAANWSVYQARRVNALPFAESARIPDEIRAASMVRAVHSDNQLFEMMVEFWHDHFNVDPGKAEQIAVTFPSYDRDVIRANALGNFGNLLKANAQSCAMLYYLDNQASRAAQPNENYAREVMELHTLGAENYYGDKTPWQAVPGATSGHALGYIDDDVYAGAKAISGWTVGIGTQISSKVKQADDGLYVFQPEYHSTVPVTRFLGYDLSTLSGQMPGLTMLDLLAKNPSTAYHIAKKLCVRFWGDNPPATMVQRVTDTFYATREAGNQIAQAIYALVTAPEFTQSPGQKYRRPFELTAGYLRNSGATVNATTAMAANLKTAGYLLYSYPTPNGEPDANGFWLSSNTVLTMWNLLLALYDGTAPMAVSSFAAQTPAGSNAIDMLNYWIGRLVGFQPSSTAYAALVADVNGAGGLASVLATKGGNVEVALRRLAGLIGATQEFTHR